MIPIPSASDRPLKPILKRTPSGVRKAVTFSATNSQVFFADDWDRSAVEVVSKLSYSDVLELKQLSLDSLPSDRHASMGLSPLLSRVPLELCPLACEGTKNSTSLESESRVAPPSPLASSPLVIPDLSILASPSSVSGTIEGSPPPSPSPPSSEAASPPVSLGTISPHTSASSPESTPPKTNAQLSAPVPIRRTLMMKFMPLLPEPGSELPSPVLSAASSSLSESSDDTEKTLPLFTPQTPTTPRTPHTPTSLSPIPASPTSPTSFSSGPQSQGPPTGRANKSRASRAEMSQFSALSGSAAGELGVPPAQTPRKSAEGGASPISPVSPASDCTVSVASSTLVRPVPRRAFTAPAKEPDPPAAAWALTRRESFGDGEPVARTKTSRSFDEKRSTRLAIAADAWVDGAVPEEPESQLTVPVLGYRTVPLPPSTPTPKARPSAPPHHRSHSFSDAQPGPQSTTPSSVKYVNPYSQIREQDEPRPAVSAEESRQHTRRSSSDRTVQRARPPPALSVPSAPQHGEDILGLAIGGPRPPPASRPTPTHRASVHGYPYGSGRPPSPTPQAFSRGVYPSPLSPNTPLPQQQQQPRPGKPLSSKDANVRGNPGTGASYTLGVGGGLGVPSGDRKPRSAGEMKPPSPNMAPVCAPLARPKNSKVGR